MTDDQRAFVRREIFPYWKGKSLEEAFLARLPEDTYRIGVDTGFWTNDSKWRQAVGEITPDYQDVLFKKGFGGILREAEDHLAALDPTNPEDLSKREFYTSVCWTSRGIIRYANRYAQAAEAMAEQEKDLSEPRSCAGSPATAGGSRSIPRRVFTRPFSSCGLSR